MFWISKKTVGLSEVWKNGFVDIHNHLLPGIDDGSKSVVQTEAMIQGMQELGITEAIATPHTYPGLWNNNSETISAAHKTVPHAFITKSSSEYFADAYLLERAEKQQLSTLKDDFLLIEFAMMSEPVDAIMDVLFELKLKGYQLVLAHPERYLYWENNKKVFDQLKTFDLNFQLNALAILGYYGPSCKKMAEYLLENDFYSFLGTDFHTLEQITFAKNQLFAEKYLKKIMPLVEANQFFSTK